MATVTNYYTINVNASTCATVYRAGVNETFSTIRAGAGTNVLASNILSYINSSSTTNQYSVLYRSITTFNTSSIPSTATITSATIYVNANTGFIKDNSLGTPTLELCSASPSSPTSIVAADYSTLGTTSFGSTTYASFNDGMQNSFTLNASGIAAINKGGYTSFGFRVGWDLTGTFGGSWVSSKASGMAPGVTSGQFITISYTVDFPTLSINNISSLSNVTTMTTS